jgi:cobalt-zinc-cadmium efflux system membrane fusion protein
VDDQGGRTPGIEGRRRPAVSWLAGTLIVGLLAGAALAGWIRAPAAGEHAVEPEESESDLPAGVVELSLEAQQSAGVEVVRAASAPLPTTLQVTGAVAPVESRVAHVRPLARGIVERVSVTRGQRVLRNEPLVTLDTIELGERVGEFLSEAAALRQAEAELEVRRRAVERAEALLAIEGIALQELDLRRAELQHAQAAVASRRARLARVEEQLHRFGLTDADIVALRPTGEADGTAGESWHRVASYNVLRAPFSGVITHAEVAPGELVGPEDELFTIADLSDVWVLADVYEKDIATLRTGREVTILVGAYPDRVFTGRLTHVSDLIDPQTRTVKVRCVVANTDGALKIDMFARIAIPTGDARDVLVVPGDAVQRIDGEPVVFVRQSPTRFERRAVRTGEAAGLLVEIVAGLEPGAAVVSTGSFYLKTALLQERIGHSH